MGCCLWGRAELDTTEATQQQQQQQREAWVRSLGWEDPLEKGKTTHSSILAWRIPWAEESAGYSPWDSKQLDTTE